MFGDGARWERQLIDFSELFHQNDHLIVRLLTQRLLLGFYGAPLHTSCERTPAVVGSALVYVPRSRSGHAVVEARLGGAAHVSREKTLAVASRA